VLSPAGTFGAGFAARGTPYDHLDSRGAARPPSWSGFLDRFRDAYRAEISHFLGVVEGAPLEGAGAAEMLRALELADAAERSARAGGSPYPVEAGQTAPARSAAIKQQPRPQPRSGAKPAQQAFR
jgi:predicted dehydrogenase